MHTKTNKLISGINTTQPYHSWTDSSLLLIIELERHRVDTVTFIGYNSKQTSAAVDGKEHDTH